MARYRGTWEYDGNIFKSKFEMGLAKQLKEAGIKYEYERESYEYFTKVTNGSCDDCSGTHVSQRRGYTPDFFLPNGVVLEAKGHFTASNRVTLKAIRKAHPTLDIRLVFQADNCISRSSKTRNSDWCEQFEFKWALRTVPGEWMK